MNFSDRPARMGVAAVAFFVAGPTWLWLALYLGLEMMGGRSHPVLEGLAWIALVIAGASALYLSAEIVWAVLRRFL